MCGWGKRKNEKQEKNREKKRRKVVISEKLQLAIISSFSKFTFREIWCICECDCGGTSVIWICYIDGRDQLFSFFLEKIDIILISVFNKEFFIPGTSVVP